RIDDFVQIEIEEALSADVKVLPVLCDNARMPAASAVPVALKPLTLINAPHLRGGRDFLGDMEKVMGVIDQFRSKQASK
ncbi:MAG TPA: hypothetical protein VG943_09865, partial [Caulobacterales bacterium]|nr:hypothetical protein [Caulobacterales bacterium]